MLEMLCRGCCGKGDGVGSAVFDCCVEDCCVEDHSVGGCSVGCCCEGRVYVNNMMGGAFGGLNGCYYGTIVLCSLGAG